MGINSTLTTNDIIREFPELKYYQLEFLIRSRQIEVHTFGSGIPRKFPPDTIHKLKSILKNRIDIDS